MIIKKSAIIIGIFSVITGVVPSLLGQTELHESVTVTAQQDPVPYESLSRSVAVLSGENIARLPVHSTSELLEYVSSVDVQSRGAMGMQADYSIRGGGFGQTLVLIDGVRLNDSQTGHHNADIPVPLEQIDRIEVLKGNGSSLYGADAFGGTINIITRKGARPAQFHFTGGEYGFVEGSASAGFARGGISQQFSGSGSRSSGFAYDRDFQEFALTSQTRFKGPTSLMVGYTEKAFGAYGFYGASPSREWTNNTLVSLNRQLASGKKWDLVGTLDYRTHGDHFLWDERHPGLFENFHRTHALNGQLRYHQSFSDKTKLAVGFDVGGDWIASNNLGSHDYSRTSGLVELQHSFKTKAYLAAGFRFDHYSNFGSSSSPAISGSWWILPRIKLRGAMGHAFRIPSFTELYYRDPNHQASATLQPETAWEGELGGDWLLGSNWMAGLAFFSRWEDNVIDWVRQSPRDKWQTANIRQLQTRGWEVELQRLLGNNGRVGVQYTYLDSDSEALPLYSLYVSNYARHSLAGQASLRLPHAVEWGQRISYKFRVDGRNYWVLDSRVTKKLGKFALRLEVTNLLDTQYQEVPGVQMPGRWIMGGVDVLGF